MTGLTAKQEKFCRLIAEGNSRADAYRGAYDVKPTTKPDTIYKRSGELLANGLVSGRIKELQESLTERCLWTREMSVNKLMEIANDPDARRADHINAVKELNSMHGYEAPKNLNIGGQLPVLRVEGIPPCSKP